MPLFRERVPISECATRIPLASSIPTLTLTGLVTGIDNLRHDVFLSPRFTALARAHVDRLVVAYGDVKELMAEDTLAGQRPPSVITPQAKLAPRSAEGAEFRDAVTELLTSALNRAKNEGNLSLECVCRLAVIKLLRQAMTAQYAAVLERCRTRLKAYEGPRSGYPQKGIELRERLARFQLHKGAILRRIGQELFSTLRDLEQTTLGRMRRSLFGERAAAEYQVFLNRLIFTEDGRDDFINAEHYVMLGKYERDPDRFGPMRDIALGFLRSLGYEPQDGLLNEPENARTLLAGGEPDASTPEGRMQATALHAWAERLENAEVMAHVIAAYEVAPLLAEYAPPLNPQQLKIALISRQERKRVQTLLDEHGKLSPDNLLAAVRRLEHCRGMERNKIVARFLKDFLRYHRDLRRLEAVQGAMDTINLITSDKLRELSSINHTLYEFSLSDEQKPAENRVVNHVIVKADIRDSSLLTRKLYERGLNPASHFSLNFYEPINKLLPKYGAQKLFIEGDAVILALFEREGEPGIGVGRACVLAKEIIEIVRGYNEQSQKSGLPTLELGIGIAYQDTAPLYLMDGHTPIMISPALNASDRLSSCSKSARRFCAGVESAFNVFAFQTIEDADTAGQPDEFLIRYNIGGIVMDEAAFQKLQQEISLAVRDVPLPTLWDEGAVRLYHGVVPVAAGIFHNVIVRESRVPHIDAREFQLKALTDRKYYEVCTNPAVYELLESAAKHASV